MNHVSTAPFSFKRSRSADDIQVTEQGEPLEWNWGKLPRVSSRDSLLIAESLNVEVPKTDALRKSPDPRRMRSQSPPVQKTPPRVSPEKKTKEPGTPQSRRVAENDKDKASSSKLRWKQLGETIQTYWSQELDPNQVQDKIEISDCAHLLEKVSEDDQMAAKEIFEGKKIDFEEFNSNPSILFSPNLVVKIENDIFPFSVAGPFLCSYIFYRRGLDDSVLETLDQKHPLMSPAPARHPER